MSEPLNDVCCASLLPESLGALAVVRDVPGVQVAHSAGRAWVRWGPDQIQVLRAVLPIRGVELFVIRDGHWYRFGCHLPAFDFPRSAEYQPLWQVLTPVSVHPILPPALSSPPVALKLVPDHRPRPATALRCGVKELARWADAVPTARLTALQAAQCGAQLLLLGARLPTLSVGERFWGTSVLAVLGYCPDPDLPARAIREALGVAEDELLLLDGAEARVIVKSVFRPLSRAQVRLALEEVAS